MDSIIEMINRGAEQLLGRASGPLHARLLIQPIVATILACRAGLKDAREGHPPFFWTVLISAEERRILVKSGWKDVGKLFIVACILDTIYQFVALHTFYPIQTLIVAISVALVPYTLLRGLVTRLTRGRYMKGNGDSAPATPKTH